MSLLGWIYGADEAQQRSNQLDADLQAANQRAVDEGYVNEKWYQDFLAREAAYNANTGTADVDRALNQSFEEGWAEGRQNVSGFIGGAINRIVADPLRAVIGGLPWWLWALGLAALAFYLWPLLRPILKRR